MTHTGKGELWTLSKNKSFEDYQALEGINATGLKEIVRSPAHYQAWRSGENVEPDTPARAFGRAVHMAILEPERFEATILPMPEGMTRRAKGFADLCTQAYADGKEMMTHLDHEACLKMRDKVHSVLFLQNLLSKGDREATLQYRDPTFDVMCKVRPDFISAKRVVVDLKTTQDARPKAFARDIEKYLYHLQAAHYLVGGEVSECYRMDAFVFLAVEKKPPFEIGIYVLGADSLAKGHQWRGFAMERYVRCMASNQWPGYPRRALPIDVPAWASVPEEEQFDNE